jgi:hypothetical protein
MTDPRADRGERADAGHRGGGSRTLRRRADRCWLLWWPCEICGGARLAIRDSDAVGHSRSAGQGPGCETRRRRRERAGTDPAVWYDTWVNDWVVRLPCRDLPEGALLPLCLGWFDAPWVEVYRAAADLAFAGEALSV